MSDTMTGPSFAMREAQRRSLLREINDLLRPVAFRSLYHLSVEELEEFLRAARIDLNSQTR